MPLSADQAIAFLQTLCAMPGDVDSKASIIAIAKAAGLPAGDFIVGDPSERELEYMGRAMGAWGVVPTQAARAFFFALVTDPGDVDDFGVPDLSADQTPRPGFLSAFGAGWWGTERGGGATSATSFVTIKNNGAAPTSPFTAGQLVLEYATATRDDGGTPTYTNTADPSIYVGFGGTLTLAAGASVTIPVQAQQLGAYGSASANLIDTVVTQSFGSLIVTASTTAIGEDREPRGDYIGRCLLAADSNAPGGPGNAYRRAMNTARGGKVLARYDGSGPVTITQAYVSPRSTTGLVTMYVGGPSGAVDDIDVDSANANILGLPLGVITDPLGVLPDTATIGPTVYSGGALPDGTPGCASCINHTIAVTYSAKIKAKDVPGGATPNTYTTGGSPPAPVLAIFTAIAAQLGADMLAAGINGRDFDGSVGVIYTKDLVFDVRAGFPGLYDPIVSTPSATTTVIDLGKIATLGSVTGALVVV